jgi:hypothetical protein
MREIIKSENEKKNTNRTKENFLNLYKALKWIKEKYLFKEFLVKRKKLVTVTKTN